MNFYTQVFADAGVQYAQMALVLSASAYEHGTMICIRNIHDTDKELHGNLRGTYYQNCRKTKHHAELIGQHKDGDVVVLMDADMLVLRALEPALLDSLGSCDIGITHRPPGHGFKINTGLVVTRVSNLTRRFHLAWAERAAQMVQEPRLYRQFASQYGGVNQSAFASVRADFPELQVAELTTGEWNAVAQEHFTAMANARVVHILGQLRRLCLSPKPIHGDPALKAIERVWRQYASCVHNVG